MWGVALTSKTSTLHRLLTSAMFVQKMVPIRKFNLLALGCLASLAPAAANMEDIIIRGDAAACPKTTKDARGIATAVIDTNVTILAADCRELPSNAPFTCSPNSYAYETPDDDCERPCCYVIDFQPTFCRFGCEDSADGDDNDDAEEAGSDGMLPKQQSNSACYESIHELISRMRCCRVAAAQQ